MIREATAMKVRQNLGELLNEVQYRGDSILRLTAELAKAYEGTDPETATKEIDEAVKAARRA